MNSEASNMHPAFRPFDRTRHEPQRPQMNAHSEECSDLGVLYVCCTETQEIPNRRDRATVCSSLHRGDDHGKLLRTERCIAPSFSRMTDLSSGSWSRTETRATLATSDPRPGSRFALRDSLQRSRKPMNPHDDVGRRLQLHHAVRHAQRRSGGSPIHSV